MYVLVALVELSCTHLQKKLKERFKMYFIVFEYVMLNDYLCSLSQQLKLQL